MDRIAQDTELAALLERHPVRAFATAYGQQLEVVVDRERAGFSAWYEMFPRCCSPKPGQHGTLQDVIDRLPYVAQMGFDVLYLPPIHPIGTTFRKGKNNATEGRGRRRWQPLGNRFRRRAVTSPFTRNWARSTIFTGWSMRRKQHGIEIALDIAFQCSPDHPYVKEHPDWFRNRPDGTIQYAENPPKKYQDIYPFDFESTDWQALWDELKSIFEFWIETRRADLPRRQSAHQTIYVLGMVHRRDQTGTSGRIVPGRSVHATEDHVSAGQARFHAVVHVLRLAKHEKRSWTEYVTELTKRVSASSSGRTSGPTRRTS